QPIPAAGLSREVLRSSWFLASTMGAAFHFVACFHSPPRFSVLIFRSRLKKACASGDLRASSASAISSSLGVFQGGCFLAGTQLRISAIVGGYLHVRIALVTACSVRSLPTSSASTVNSSM